MKARASRGTSRFRKNFRPSKSFLCFSCASSSFLRPSSCAAMSCRQTGQTSHHQARSHPHRRSGVANDPHLPSRPSSPNAPCLPTPSEKPCSPYPVCRKVVHLDLLLCRCHRSGQTGTEGCQFLQKRSRASRVLSAGGLGRGWVIWVCGQGGKG